MKIIVFGTGQIYREKKEYISCNDEVIGFLDNNRKLWGTRIDGVSIYNPENISELYYDEIVLMSNYALEMKEQLLKLNCDKTKILHYLEYIEAQSVGEMKILFPLVKKDVSKKKCLIITTELAYNGGSIAAYYAAIAMQRREYEPVIATPKCDTTFCEEIRKCGISVIIYKNLSHAKRNELFWVNNFQYVLVNTLQMSCCAVEIAKLRKVNLWIHEPHNLYEVMSYWHEDIQEGIKSKNLKVHAVSSGAKLNFIKNFKINSMGILPYGIPDEYTGVEKNENEKMVFAMIGLISEQKGQDIFLKAIEKLNVTEEKIDFLIIGRNLQDTYGKQIENKVQKNSNVHFWGEVPHEKVMRYWQDIDVLVAASREDTLSIVATEAMMLGKVCIVSNEVGIANYMENFNNGLIFSTKNSDELAKKIQWCIKYRKELRAIGKSAREVYENNFSMEIFGENLEKMLKQ